MVTGDIQWNFTVRPHRPQLSFICMISTDHQAPTAYLVTRIWHHFNFHFRHRQLHHCIWIANNRIPQISSLSTILTAVQVFLLVALNPKLSFRLHHDMYRIICFGKVIFDLWSYLLDALELGQKETIRGCYQRTRDVFGFRFDLACTATLSFIFIHIIGLISNHVVPVPA